MIDFTTITTRTLPPSVDALQAANKRLKNNEKAYVIMTGVSLALVLLAYYVARREMVKMQAPDIQTKKPTL